MSIYHNVTGLHGLKLSSAINLRASGIDSMRIYKFKRNTIRRFISWWGGNVFYVIRRPKPSLYVYFTPKYHYEISLFKIDRWEKQTRLRSQRLCHAQVTGMIGFDGCEIALSSPNAEPWFSVHYRCSNSRTYAWEVDGHIRIATDGKRWYDLESPYDTHKSLILTKKDQKVINNTISKYIKDVVNA